MSAHPGITWPFPVGTETEPADYEPTDLELASNGINTYPSDPGDSPSYANLNSPKGPTS